MKPACAGKRVDADHELVVAYLKKRAIPAPSEAAEGIDPLYEDAIAACRDSGRWTAKSVRAALKIGSVRAGRIMSLIKAAGRVESAPPPEPTVVTLPPKPTKPRTTKLSKQAKREAETGEKRPPEIPSNIVEFLDYTLRDIIMQFGTDIRFEEYLKATKTIEDINDKRIKNAVAEGKLVSRELITKAVIDPIDSMHRKLLKGGSKTISMRLHRKFGAGDSVKKGEDDVRDQITSFIRPMKARVARMLKNL